jgi:hypothetical protein
VSEKTARRYENGILTVARLKFDIADVAVLARPLWDAAPRAMGVPDAYTFPISNQTVEDQPTSTSGWLWER